MSQAGSTFGGKFRASSTNSCFPVREVIALNHLGHVLDGEGTYMKEMYNRIEGKVIEVVVGAISDKMNLSDIMAQVNNQTKTGER